MLSNSSLLTRSYLIYLELFCISVSNSKKNLQFIYSMRCIFVPISPFLLNQLGKFFSFLKSVLTFSELLILQGSIFYSYISIFLTSSLGKNACLHPGLLQLFSFLFFTCKVGSVNIITTHVFLGQLYSFLLLPY